MRGSMIGMTAALALAAAGAWAQSGGAAAPLGGKEYVVFFPADQAVLTAQAQVIVGRVAKAAKLEQTGGTLGHVKVIGYSDATRGPGAAEQLAAARAEAIKQALAQAGIDANAIRIEGRGRPLAKDRKPDDVSELINRRARIVLYGPGK